MTEAIVYSNVSDTDSTHDHYTQEDWRQTNNNATSLTEVVKQSHEKEGEPDCNYPLGANYNLLLT